MLLTCESLWKRQQLFTEAVTQSTWNLKTKTTKIRLDHYTIGPTHHLSVAFLFTIVGF